MQTARRIGVMFRCQYTPETLVSFVRQAEAAGFDDVWIVEDCFFAGGLTSVSVALAATEHIRVGLGIVPAVSRNPAFLAMEIAALCRLFPGRFLPGLGHGVADWMRQVGAFPASQLAALEETTLAVGGLLAGDTVTQHGQHVNLESVRLAFPPAEPPPVLLGVRGPKSLRMAGASADGAILSEMSSPAYVAWARDQLTRGRRQAGRDGQPTVVTYAWFSVDDDAQRALDRLRPDVAGAVAGWQPGPQLTPDGLMEEAMHLRDRGGYEVVVAEMPDDWIRTLAIAGTPADCSTAVQRLLDAGADTVVLVPPVQLRPPDVPQWLREARAVTGAGG